MTKDELRAILNSDMKLWERASTTEEGGTLTKSIDLPYGIGEYSLSFAGLHDAESRRQACEIFGKAIRDEVNNTISDEAVSARARQRAALSSEDDGGDVGSDGGGPERGETLPNQEAVSPFNVTTTFAEDPARRLDELRRAANAHTAEARRLQLEIKGLEAYMEVVNASEVQEETPTSTDE